MVTVAGVGVAGIGLFFETAPLLHLIFSFIAFFFGVLSAIAAFKIQKPPLSHLSVIMGAVSLLALILLATKNDLGLGISGMERMIVLPNNSVGNRFRRLLNR